MHKISSQAIMLVKIFFKICYKTEMYNVYKNHLKSFDTILGKPLPLLYYTLKRA